MKLLSFLIAIMVLALSCMPCSDTGIFTHGNNSRVTTSHTQTTQHIPGEEHQDLCSPFCQCACCSLAYALPFACTPGTWVKAGWSDQQFVSFVSHCPSGIALPVWQPPQLV